MKRNNFLKKRFLGQSLVEMVVVLGMITVSLVALVKVATVAIYNARAARAQSRAIDLARDAVEWLRGEREKGFSQFAQHASENGTVYCFQDLSWENDGSCSDDQKIDGLFKREGNLVLAPSGDRVEVTITVSWSDNKGDHSQAVETYLTKQ